MGSGNGKQKAGTDVVEMTSPNNGATPRPKSKRGPIKDRSCTDIICLALFLVFIAGLVVISIFAYTNGNPRLLLYPVDSDGNRFAFGSVFLAFGSFLLAIGSFFLAFGCSFLAFFVCRPICQTIYIFIYLYVFL